MSGKFEEYTVWTDEDSSLAELDAEHFAKSVRERIDIAVRAKEKWQGPARYFFEMIEETAEDFLCEDQVYPENRSRYDEIRKAYDEFVPAFRFLRDHIKDDKPLDGALRDVMWNSFLIGLACDRERLENPEILERYSSSVTGRARTGRKKKQDEWSESVYKAVCLAIPVADETNKNFRRPAKTTECADILFKDVLNQLVRAQLDEDNPRGDRLDERAKQERENALKSRLKERLKLAAIRRALGRFIDENGKMDASARGVRRPDAS